MNQEFASNMDGTSASDMNHMISAHMLVKNEEAYIEASIRSIHDIVDEIVVIDNGSTDRTQDILTSFDKVKVIYYEGDWMEVGEHNLRNAGLRECKGKFIWIWDGDEVLYEGQKGMILSLLDDEFIGCWRFKQLEFFGDHFHLQDQYRGPELDGEGEIIPGYGRQVIHGHPIIYRSHPGLRYVENAGMKYGLHSAIRGTQKPNSEAYCPDILYAHYGSCKSNSRLYNKTLFYYDGVKDPNDMCHTEEFLSQIESDNPLGYHPDQAVRPFFGRHPIYMEGNAMIFHRIETTIDDEGKARIVSRSDVPLEVEIKIGTPSDCGRSGCNYNPPSIDAELKRNANEYTVIKALDYYTPTAELCMIHPNVFVMLNENVPDNPQFTPETKAIIRGIIHTNARHFVAVSESVRNALIIDGVPPEKITVINFWGCDTNHWKLLNYSMQEKDIIRNAFNPEISRDIVLFVGRLVSNKGIEYLLEALPNIRGDTSIVLAGEGNFEYFSHIIDPEFRKRVFHLGTLDRDALLKLYNIAKVLVLPSVPIATWIEQFGRVLTEAMACELPCISTDIGGPRDIIDDGITGFLIRPADSDAISERVNYILNHPDEATRMGFAGRTRVLHKFADDVCQEAMMQCIRTHML